MENRDDQTRQARGQPTADDNGSSPVREATDRAGRPYLAAENSPSHIEWARNPDYTMVAIELLQSDAFKVLTRLEVAILLFILQKRRYPSRRERQRRNSKIKFDYWRPINAERITVTLNEMDEFYGEDKMVSRSTLQRASKKLMKVGFLDVVEMGGNGQGDAHIFRLTNEWRMWRIEDKPCFNAAGLSRERGFAVKSRNK